MKVAFLTTGLVASLFACPWFFAQESSSAPSGQKPGYSSTSPSTTVVARIPGQQDQAPSSTTQPALALPPPTAGYPLPSGTLYAAPFLNNELAGVPTGQWLNPNDLPDAKARQAYAEAYRAYQTAADDSARNKAMAELKTGLEKQYDAYVEAQARQITQLEERLQKLKEQLEKRRSAKVRMVELKLQMVLSQAEGLGFPDNGFPNGATIYGDAQNRYRVQDSSSLLIPNAYPALVPAATAPVAPLSLPPLQVLPPAAPAPQTPAGGGGDQNKID